MQHYRAQFRVGDVDVKYGGKKMAGTILDGSPRQFADVNDLNLLEGRLFTDEEDQRARMCACLATTRADDLFGGETPIGKEVTVESGVYTVIGVLDQRKQPSAAGKNPNDNLVYFPLETFHNLHPEDHGPVGQREVRRPEKQGARPGRDSRAAAHPAPGKTQADDNFDIFGPDSLTELWGQITGGLVAS